jgi:formate--tetrahydrofolate ligase
VRKHVHTPDVDTRGGQRRGDPASLGARKRRHLGGDELPVDDCHQIGERAADVDPDADTTHHAIFARIGLLRQMATTKMPSSLEIAQQATLRPIAELAADIGLEEDEVELYGRYKAKVDLSVLDRLRDQPNAKLIGVTAITPTKAGEGKTTTAVSLTQGLGTIGKNPVLCLREASLGPVFGIKGGAAGGGYAQVVPMEDLNLHFTGDIHAIGAANNLLSAMLEAHILHGNELGIDPLTVSWRRCMDMNDRALRNVVLGLGGRANGYVRETGFDITAASEVMAITAVARDLFDLRKRLGAITVAYTWEGEPVTAEQLKAAGAMTVLLKDAIKPNLVQTLEGQPAFIHCGPFANIAHGNSSLVADLVGLKLGDYVVTESGFGADMGMEKFLDIVCRVGSIAPSAIVLVATVKALKHHGDDPEGGVDAIERGAGNLARHIGIIREFGLNAVVAINAFPGDTDEEVATVRRLALELGAHAAAVNTAFEDGGEGARELAEAVVDAAEKPNAFEPMYELDAPIVDKIESIAKRVYGADGIFLLPAAENDVKRFTEQGLDNVPICMAKTHLSLSHDPALTNAPTGFTVPVRAVRAYTGAGWLVALCGDMQTMPGLSASPAAFNVDIDENGRTVGLF